MIISKIQFSTGEVLTQAKMEWLEKIKLTNSSYQQQYQTVNHHIIKSPSTQMINIVDNESIGLFDGDTRNNLNNVPNSKEQSQTIKHSNFRITAQGFKKFLETDINFMSNRPKSSKPTTAATNKKRSEIVKFDNVKDTQLPKFTAKVIVDSGNNHKPRNINSLAMKGIKPPRPRGKKANENDDKQLENMEAPGEIYKQNAEPEFPPRFGLRFGSTLNIKKLNLAAETFKNDSRDFVSTVKNQ